MECLEKGVFLERETRKPSAQPHVTLKKAVEYDEDVREVSGFEDKPSALSNTKQSKTPQS